LLGPKRQKVLEMQMELLTLTGSLMELVVVALELSVGNGVGLWVGKGVGLGVGDGVGGGDFDGDFDGCLLGATVVEGLASCDSWAWQLSRLPGWMLRAVCWCCSRTNCYVGPSVIDG
jgi:hypothetical protein